MSATRRQQPGRLPARKAPAAGVARKIVAASQDAVQELASPHTVDPVCADPAVVLWDEVAPPDPASGEDAGKPAAPAADRALH